MTNPYYGTAAPPPLPYSERLRIAWQSRHNSDYIAAYWTALGWTILTFGIYGFYIFYQLMRRMRDHVARKAEFIEAATGVAWEQAQRQGKTEELRPHFERLSYDSQTLRSMSADFRDPAIWTIIYVFVSIASYIGFYLLDQDLVKLEATEARAEAELAAVYTALGQPVHAVPKTQKAEQNIAGRVIALVFSCGFYGLWWWYDAMDDANRHFEEDWPFEDQIAGAAQAMIRT